MTTPDTDAVRTALSTRPSTAQGVADATGIPIRRVHTLLRRVGASEVGFAPRTGGRPAALWALPTTPAATPTPPAPTRVGGDEVFVALSVFAVLGMWIYLFYSAL